MKVNEGYQSGIAKDMGAGQNPVGVVCAANESRFDASYLSTALTSYAQGWRDGEEDLERVINRVCGTPIQAPMRFSYQTFPNAEDFYVDDDDRRPIGGEFKQVERTAGEAEARLHNRGLTVRVDEDGIGGANSDNPMGDEQWVAWLLQRCHRSELKRALDLLSAAATNTNVIWDTTAGKDPDADVRGELLSAADITGVRPRRVVYSDTAWDRRDLSHRAQDSAGGFASANLTPGKLARRLRVDHVEVVDQRYQTGASTKAQLLGTKVLMFVAVNGGMPQDPSNIKRFVKGGVRVFVQQTSTKFRDITVEFYSRILITSTLGVRQLTTV